MGAPSTIQTESGESIELKEGIVLDHDGRPLTAEPRRPEYHAFRSRVRFQFQDEAPKPLRFSLLRGNSLWVLMLAFFTPVLVIASFLAFGSLAAVLGVAFLAFGVIRGIARLFT